MSSDDHSGRGPDEQLGHRDDMFAYADDEEGTRARGTGASSAGTHVLQGEEALQYVRTRYSLPGGDFGRIDRQQNFIRSMMRKMLSRGTLTNPFTFTPTLNAVVST